MGREVTVDYLVPLTVRVDLKDKVVTEVWLHLDCFQSTPRGRWRQLGDDGGGPDLYLRDVHIDLDGEEPGEFCDGEHPLADEAFAIADRVRLLKPEFQVDFILEEEPEVLRSGTEGDRAGHRPRGGHEARTDKPTRLRP